MKEYLEQQKKTFEDLHQGMTRDNHYQHNMDINYWNLLLYYVKFNPTHWKNKAALDVGCGCGRNLRNLLDLAPFKRTDGVDISGKNAKYSFKYLRTHHPNAACHTWENDGATLEPAKDETYDLVMSHQVFQHISNYEVRFSLLKDCYRVLKKEGLLTIHFMDLADSSSYYENSTKLQNVYIEDTSNVIDDLVKIGFDKSAIKAQAVKRKQINILIDETGHGPTEYYFTAIK